MRKISIAGPALGVLLLAACAKIADGPLSPLVDPSPRATFDSNFEGWVFHYADPAPASPPAAGVNPLFSKERFLFGGGALLFDFNFSPPITKFAAGPVFSPPVDLRGKTLSLWVLWESGLVESEGRVGCKLFLWDDVSGWFVGGPFHNLQRGKWVQTTFAVDFPADLNAAASALPYEQIAAAVPKVGLEVNVLDTDDPKPGRLFVDQFAY